MFQMEEEFYMLIHIFQRSTATLKTISQIAVITAYILKHPTPCSLWRCGFQVAFSLLFYTSEMCPPPMAQSSEPVCQYRLQVQPHHCLAQPSVVSVPFALRRLPCPVAH